MVPQHLLEELVTNTNWAGRGRSGERNAQTLRRCFGCLLKLDRRPTLLSVPSVLFVIGKMSKIQRLIATKPDLPEEA